MAYLSVHGMYVPHYTHVGLYLPRYELYVYLISVWSIKQKFPFNGTIQDNSNQWMFKNIYYI
jgi:hypothetical protein